MISVILVDDHKLILEGISNVLNEEKDITILSTYTLATEALKFLENNDVDIVITDLDMPEMNGIRFINAARKIKPALKFIVLSMLDEQSIINRMVKYEVNGYLMKNKAQSELAKAIRSVGAGDNYYNKEIRAKIFNTTEQKETPDSSIPRLSKREKEILKYVVHEHTTKKIAEILFISEGTVITHRKHIQAKLGAKNTAGVVRIAMELGLI